MQIWLFALNASALPHCLGTLGSSPEHSKCEKHFEIHCSWTSYPSVVFSVLLRFFFPFIFLVPFSLFSYFFVQWRNSPSWARFSTLSRLHDHTKYTALGTTPLDEWSARRRDLYLTTHNIQETESHTPTGFEPTILASERLQTDSLEGAAIGIGLFSYSLA
jgi:hypothetical protein